MKYVILIPVYKPDNELLRLLKDIDKKYSIVVINDGSGKEYDEVFKEVKKYAHLISYNENKGKGYALKKGLEYIKNTYKDYIVVTMDSDGQHTLKDALKLCEYAKDNLDTLVLGKRLLNKNTPLRSKIGNAITRYVFKKKTGFKIYDTQTGLRAFSYKLNNYMLKIPGWRYEYEMNVLLNLRNDNIKYKEIPIETIYFDHNRKSHFNTLKDAYLIYKNIFKYKKM